MKTITHNKKDKQLLIRTNLGDIIIVVGQINTYGEEVEYIQIIPDKNSTCKITATVSHNDGNKCILLKKEKPKEVKR